MQALVLAIAVSTAAKTPPGPVPDPWLRIDYSALVDTREISHSGEPVSALLSKLAGRRLGERAEDGTTFRLLTPLLEKYAFVLPDALDSRTGLHDPPYVEVGGLWETGESQPAWVELVRARQLVLESDGAGHLRACLPAASLESIPGDPPPTLDAVATAKEAWESAWPVLRHALAGERRRLARSHGGTPPALDVEVHAYRHRPESLTFDLGAQAFRTTIQETGPPGDRPQLDLLRLSSILERGLTIEGARLQSDGRIRWFTSEPETKPTVLGRTPTVADLAVAYRAIAHGGAGEPYMSLDRAGAPFVANVNYGGRLRDTALGLVSLLSDVRFKTFSLGIDLLGEGDVRETVRRTLPEFRTHLERFAANPTTGAVLNQQTRFWFYPDDVDLTLSQQGDVLAFRKVRMSPASERVGEAGQPVADPPWTTDTVHYLASQYDALASLFPEMADLDESVRLLALFTWLESARGRGLAVPDLDVLMAIELPALPTPGRFPELLSHDVLPPAGTAGVVDVLDRTDVGIALDRLEPADGRMLPADRRFSRDLAMLAPQIADQAALAKEMSTLPAGATPERRDVLSYRAERLLMHARVLATIPSARQASIAARRDKEPGTRVFSVGIGGIDLGMTAVLARASQQGSRLGMSSGDAPAGPTKPAAAVADSNGSKSDPPLPSTEWPEHGLGEGGRGETIDLPGKAGSIVGNTRPGSEVRSGTYKTPEGGRYRWSETISGADGPGVRTRRVVQEPGGGTIVERVEGPRSWSFSIGAAGPAVSAVPARTGLPPAALGPARPQPPAAEGPPPLPLLDLAPGGDEASLSVRLRGADGRERTAAVPRSVLQRLVRGRAVDATPERPLPGFTPASQVLGGSGTLMVLAAADQTAPPWRVEPVIRPGEEDPIRLARALTSWWAADSGTQAAAIVGTEGNASPVRWRSCPRLDASVRVSVLENAWPAQSKALRDGLSGLPAAEAATVVLVVSAESPGVFGRRLRALAQDPQMSGKILVAASLGGPLRQDLPASLLDEGRIRAFGLLEGGPVGFSKTVGEIASFARLVAAESSKGKRIEELPGPFTWFY